MSDDINALIAERVMCFRPGKPFIPAQAIEDTMRVFQHMQKAGYAVQITMQPDGFCIITVAEGQSGKRFPNQGMSYSAEGDVPLAACRAILTAMGVSFDG